MLTMHSGTMMRKYILVPGLLLKQNNVKVKRSPFEKMKRTNGNWEENKSVSGG